MPPTDILNAEAVPSEALSIPVNPLALVPENPTVALIGSRLRWKPQTVIARVERALSTQFTQSLYLLVAKDFSILPETMAALLRTYAGTESFIERDLLHPRDVGDSLATDAFANFADFFFACMDLLKVVTQEYTAFNMSILDAGELVAAYGDREPEKLIEMIDADLDHCSEVLGISLRLSASQRLRMCLHVFISEILPENRERGLPDLVDVNEVAELYARRRNAIRAGLWPDRDPDEDAIRESDNLIHGTQVERRSVEETIDELTLSFPAGAYDADNFTRAWWNRGQAQSAGGTGVEQGDSRSAIEQCPTACGDSNLEPALSRNAA